MKTFLTFILGILPRLCLHQIAIAGGDKLITIEIPGLNSQSSVGAGAPHPHPHPILEILDSSYCHFGGLMLLKCLLVCCLVV
jgi:hypothetical protein